MRALSLSQASRCETAEGATCRCRCGGVFHGRNKDLDAREYRRDFFEELPGEDPHHLPTAEERKDRARARRRGLTLDTPRRKAALPLFDGGIER